MFTAKITRAKWLRVTRTRHLLITLLLLTVLVISGIGKVQGETAFQNSEVIPSRIISSTPAQREVAAPSSTIRIFFDQPMDRASVESALSIEPKLDGQLSWADDSTLTYTPAAPMPRGTEYTVKIAPTAKSASGAPLEDTFRLTFLVTPPLGVNQVVPTDGVTQVEAGATITIVFNRPVVPLVNSADQDDLPQPLTITPAVEGKGEWVGTSIYVFRPTKALAGGTKYTVAVSSDLKDVEGTTLDKAYNWTFTTIAPQLQYVNPSPESQLVTLETAITAQFNQPMDVASLKEAFSLRNTTNGANVSGTFTFNEDNSYLTFTPTSKLELGTTYQVTIAASARSASGNATLTNPTTAKFTTVPFPQILGSFPKNGDKVEPGSGVSIIFNTYMDSSSFAGKVTVDPKPENLTISPSGTNLHISFQTLPATTYTVTLAAGVKDNYGNTIKDPYTFTFSTLDALPSFGLATRDLFAVTSAYRDVTTILAAAINISQIDLKLSALEIPELFASFDEYGNPQYNYTPPRVTRSWTEKIEAKKNERVALPIQLAEGGKLSPGVYFLEASAPEFAQVGYPSARHFVIVATAAITMKIGPDEAMLWVTDLKTGQPVKGATVDLYSRRTKVASGTTDDNGLFHTTEVKGGNYDSQPFYVVVTGDGIFSFGSSNWQDEMYRLYDQGISVDYTVRKDVAYLYTDQPVYRPGHPVLFRGVIRNQDDVTFTVPANQKVMVYISDPQGQEVYKQELTLNQYASFSGKYEPPANAPLGNYSLRVEYYSGSSVYQQTFYLNFQIAEFRPPEFIVNAKANAKEYVAGDTIKVEFDSQFFFGGPVSNGKVTWVAIANQGFFNYTGNEYYDFSSGGRYYYDNDYVYNRQVAQGTGTLDESGKLTIEVPADLAGGDDPLNFTIEATVTDISNQAISGRTTVMVHPSKVYIGLAPSAYVGQAEKPMDIKVISVNWNSEPIANQNITLKVVEKRWEQDPNTLQWSQKDHPVTDGKVTTDDQGKAVFTFTPPRGGYYEIEATTRDDGERIARTVTSVWVAGPNYVPWDRDQKNITLVLDKKQYDPGDIASILIPSPFPEPVQALVTVERAKIMKSEIVTITGSYTYKLPLEVVHAPNVYVSVTIMRGSGETDKSQVPELRLGVINIPVSVQQQLKINITPSTTSAKPGDKVTFAVQTTDLTGEPVAAEVGLSLSDLANLSVGRDNSGKIFDFFWSPRSLAISTIGNLTRLIDPLTEKDVRMMQARRQGRDRSDEPAGTNVAQAGVVSPDAAPAAQAAAENEVGFADGLARKTDDLAKEQDENAPAPPRTNFVDTPLWVPDLVTDASGKATAEVTLPDNLTTWRLNARAISMKTYVGDTTLDIVSTKPLLVRPSTPRFFVVGDESELAVVVNNNTDQDLDVEVVLNAKGVTLKADAKQTVKVAKSGRTRIIWLATVQDVDNVDLSFSAVSGEYGDASKPAVGLGDERLLPVYDYLAPDYVSTAGTLTRPGTRTEAVMVPNATLAPRGELTLKLQPSLAATTIDGLNYLKNYPYQCVEQTVSKFLPNVITFRALQKLQLDKPELRANLEAAVNYALGRLKREQHGDGGWGWFPQERSNPQTSTYALLGLVEAKLSDLPVDQDMYQRAISYVMSTVFGITDTTPVYDLNRLSFTLYVLTRAGQPNMSVMDAMFERREKMHLFARSFLAQAYYYAKGDQAKMDTLVSDLQTAAIASATGTHWEEREIDWWNWDSNTRTTAIVLETLVKITPQSELIPNIVRWMMVARKGDAWETTQETAWAVMALTNWMDVSNELRADYAFNVKVNDKSVGEGQANAETLRDTKTLVVSVQDMLRDQANRVTFEHSEGAGNLYYTATLRVVQPVELIEPTNRGIGLSRTYYLDGKPVTSAKVGDTITVALEITAASDLYYVNIDDPIPAGTELVDKSLQTTTQVGEPPELTLIDPYYGGWGWWYFSNTELRTEKMVLSASYLPRGTYRFVYQIRASSVGTYKVIPPNGNQFYFPEVFGRGAGSLFTIVP